MYTRLNGIEANRNELLSTYLIFYIIHSALFNVCAHFFQYGGVHVSVCLVQSRYCHCQIDEYTCNYILLFKLIVCVVAEAMALHRLDELNENKQKTQHRTVSTNNICDFRLYAFNVAC